MTRTTIEMHPSGTFFDFADPRPEMIHVEDIARALSQINRFGGHTRFPYSVAQHALLVARLVRERGGSPELQFAALHHDSHEAYLGDVPTPLKAMLGRTFANLANLVDQAIWEALDIPFLSRRDDDAIKAADAKALLMEAAVLKVSQGVGEAWGNDRPLAVWTGAVKWMEPEWAEHLFLAAHHKAVVACPASQC